MLLLKKRAQDLKKHSLKNCYRLFMQRRIYDTRRKTKSSRIHS
jgi:hypothetical protein